MFSGFVVFFCCLGFLGYRFSRSFVVLFRCLGFLRSGWFSVCFFVFFSGLGFLGSGWFSVCFFVFFGSLRFLLCSRFCRSFVLFFVMSGLGSRAVGSSWRLSGACCISSESGRRETHSSGNDQS
ncbi:hypothetical protein SB6095_03255 [Klebsiella quasivariicola]|uniref:Uncharacterized protein n=1 Tax=Klebsiella quasivariicola TaxID=2026240 RepID=A0A6C2V909_9ENTR|nr:Uncharacterised protein [Klebsiella quasivariicola]SLY37456.1 Uncharacterised protein [Klebsiella quasivariicola]SXD41868.1 Uncharacterised protein [Klebsiella quasivariicola]SXD86839.1 Uncharacterised protein [Klebsiella quasivariicola]VAN47516.1 Uncharacterised protein [Klebsiella quasivariicola]